MIELSNKFSKFKTNQWHQSFLLIQKFRRPWEEKLVHLKFWCVQQKLEFYISCQDFYFLIKWTTSNITNRDSDEYSTLKLEHRFCSVLQNPWGSKIKINSIFSPTIAELTLHQLLLCILYTVHQSPFGIYLKSFRYIWPSEKSFASFYQSFEVFTLLAIPKWFKNVDWFLQSPSATGSTIFLWKPRSRLLFAIF